MYYVLVLALAAGAYAFIPYYLTDIHSTLKSSSAPAYRTVPDYLGAYYNNLKANKLMEERLKLRNNESLNHLMLVVAIRELADAVNNLPHVYSYIYDETVEKVISRVLGNPTAEANYLNYKIRLAESLTTKVQDLVQKYCYNSLRVVHVSCNKDVDNAIKKNNLQSGGRFQLALGDISYDYMSILPTFDVLAKNNLAEDYLRNEGREELLPLVEKIEALNKNL